MGKRQNKLSFLKSLKKEVFNFPSKRNTWFHQSFGTMLRSLVTCAKKGVEALFRVIWLLIIISISQKKSFTPFFSHVIREKGHSAEALVKPSVSPI